MNSSNAAAEALLAKQVTVTYTSSSQISRVDAIIWYDDPANCLQVEFVQEGPEECQIVIDEITSIKAKDYLEEGNFCWVVVIATVEAKQHFLQFFHQQDRETWMGALRVLVDTATRIRTVEHAEAGAEGQAAEGEAISKNKSITEVHFRKPDVGFVVSLSLDLSDKTTVSLEVPKTEPLDLKSFVRKFVQTNEVDKQESTSLYRLISSLLKKVRLEVETEQLIEAISAQSLDNLVAEQGQVQGTKIDIQALKLQAEATLSELETQVKTQMAEQGTGASIVAMILRKNIDKMKLSNDLSARAYNAESQVTDQLKEQGW